MSHGVSDSKSLQSCIKSKKKKEEEEEREVEKNLEMLNNKYFGQGLLPYNLFFKQE